MTNHSASVYQIVIIAVPIESDLSYSDFSDFDFELVEMEDIESLEQDYNIELLSNWMIVEKAGMGGTGTEAFRSEYDQVLSNVSKHEDSYIFEL